MVLSTLFGQFPFLKRLFADSAYAGPVFRDGLANALPSLVTEIVLRGQSAGEFGTRLAPDFIAWLIVTALAAATAGTDAPAAIASKISG